MMKNTKAVDILQAMSDINDNFIFEAETEKARRKRGYMAALIGVAAILGMCGFGYAVTTYYGSDFVKESSYAEIEQPFDTVASTLEENSIEEKITSAKLQQESVVKENPFVEAVCTYKTTDSQLPDIYFSPAYMVVFSNEAGEEWKLDRGTAFSIDFTLADEQNLTLEIGIMCDGKFQSLSMQKSNAFHESYVVTTAGEYTFCIVNHSSENAIIKEGSITVEE